jgi:hypothetical protein
MTVAQLIALLDQAAIRRALAAGDARALARADLIAAGVRLS